MHSCELTAVNEQFKFPTDEVVVATVIQLSTRGTVGSDNW